MDANRSSKNVGKHTAWCRTQHSRPLLVFMSSSPKGFENVIVVLKDAS